MSEEKKPEPLIVEWKPGASIKVPRVVLRTPVRVEEAVNRNSGRTVEEIEPNDPSKPT